MNINPYVGYAVQVRRKDGSHFMATGSDGTMAIFYHWKEAAEYRRKLKEHVTSVGKIVKVGVTVNVISKGN